MGWKKLGIPTLNGNNYAFWTGKMKEYLQAQVFYVWNVVLTEYMELTTPPSDDNERRAYEIHGKAKNSLMIVVSDFIYV